MDAQSFTVAFIPRLFGVKQQTLDRLLGRDGMHESIMSPMERVFQTTLSGDSLNRITLSGLSFVADTLNSIPRSGISVPNLYMWLRDIMSVATSTALFGRESNPYGKDSAVVDAQWYSQLWI